MAFTAKERETVREAAALIERETAETGSPVTIKGFGTFKRVARAARVGRNPQTGAAVKIPACSVLRFSSSPSQKREE